MKYLTIIRHAKSSWENPDLVDFDRPLNERGKSAIKIIGSFLKEKNIETDLVISSPAKRARQTAICIGKFLHYKSSEIHFEPEIYFGNAASILSIIKKTDNKYNDIFIFGHEPILSSLIEFLTENDIEKFPTCAVYRIVLDIECWKNITSSKAKCEFYVNPKLLMKK